MVDLNTLYEDLRKQQVALYPYDVGNEKSVTIELNNKFAIFLDPFRVESIQEMKYILAHEIGHCATGCTHKVCSPLDIVQRHEHKANRWAIERYLPLENINAAIRQGYTEPWQLADYFDLPEGFVQTAIKHYANARQMVIG